MQPFEHHSPESLSEALQILQDTQGTGTVIAGGSDLVLQMRNQMKSPGLLINIKRLPELKGISYDKQDGLRIGALTTLQELVCSDLVARHAPALVSAARQMASAQVRGFATLGGNLCNASPSADTAPPLIAEEASVSLVSPVGERRLPLEDFFLGPGETVLQPGELMQSIQLSPKKSKALFIKHAPRVYMDISVVCIALRLVLHKQRCAEARIVLGAVAPTPFRAAQAEAELVGHPLSPDRIQVAARLAAQACQPIDDVKGAAWYRKRMVAVLVERGLTAFSHGRGGA